MLIGGLVLSLAIVIGAVWYYSGQGQSYASKAQTETLTNAQVTNVLKTSATPPIEPIAHSQTAPAIQLQARQHPHGYLFRGGP